MKFLGDQFDGEQGAFRNSPVRNVVCITDSTYNVTNDHHIVCCDTTSNNIQINLPTAVGVNNKELRIVNIGTGTVTIVPNGSEVINNQVSAALVSQYSGVITLAEGGNWFAVFGRGNELDEAGESKIYFGQLMEYPNAGNVFAANGIEYNQIYLQVGVEIGSMEVYVVNVPNSADIRLGIYSQSDPTSYAGVPNAKVAETASTPITAADESAYKVMALTSSYTIPTTGYYWFALICTRGNTDFSTSASFPTGYIPLREQSGTGSTLPTTATSVAYGASASMIFKAGIRA